MYLLVDGPLLDYDLNAIGTFVNKVCIAMKRPLVIMASEYSQAAINWFIQLRSGVQVGESEELVRIPILAIIVNTANELGNERLRDLEAALGAKALPTKEGKLLDPPNANTILSYLGRSSKIKTVPFYCRIIGAQGDEGEIAGRVAEIQKEIAAKSDSAQDETVGYERVESLKRRIAMLNGEMCSIKVGGIGYKEKEMKRLLVEDAVYATKATIDKGITIGGNVSIYQCINTYRNDIENEITANLIKAKASIIIGNNEKDIKKVVSKLLDIVSTSFLSAYHNVLMNAFDNNHKVNKIINEIKKSQPNAISFNIVKGEYEEFDRNNHSVNQVLGTVNYLPDLIVPGNTDIELMKSVFGIIGIFITSNQFMTFHNGPAKK
jgi:chaperonin GroEL (HSP60 family)